jgi:protein-S-isoprenylcysteine O-methyltransferase Ste14
VKRASAPARPTRLDVSLRERALAVALGVACHASFLAGVGAMAASLHEGLRFGVGPLRGAAAWSANVALALSFPALHSWLLTARGGAWLDRISARFGRELRATTFALSASLHLVAVFALWSPAGATLWRAHGVLAAVSEIAFGASWILLAKAMHDASLAVQTGWLGWSSVARGRAPAYPAFRPRGLFRFTRQPIYLAFACALWAGPWMTTDRLVLACLWTVYCWVGPIHKESRFLAREPDRYGRYRDLVPYWLPRLLPRRLE